MSTHVVLKSLFGHPALRDGDISIQQGQVLSRLTVDVVPRQHDVIRFLGSGNLWIQGTVAEVVWTLASGEQEATLQLDHLESFRL